MDNDFFLGSGIQPQSHLELSSNCFFSPHFESSMDQFTQFESTLSSIVSSPVSASNSVVSKEKLPNLGDLIGNYPPVSGDPGFAERAAKFSCFGSRSFNSRARLNNGNELGGYNRFNGPLMGNNSLQKMSRVLSSPSLQLSAHENDNLGQKQVDIRLNQRSPVSSLVSDLNSRKRKAISRGKCKETKVTIENENLESKRHKDYEGDGSGNGSGKTEVEKQGNCNRNGAKNEEEKGNTKSSEPQKDYIHVRARRGQATDSHSLAERVRREKISERMKLLQDLVPGCNKVTGKALMLDEIINYVQTLQRQVEFLSMKLATVNPRLDFNTDSLLPKDGVNGSMSHQIDTSASIALFGHHNQKWTEVQNNFISNGATIVDPLHTIFRPTIGSHSSQLDEISNGLTQFQTLCEDDLQNIIQMGFSRDMGSNSQGYHGSNEACHMKVEL